MSILVEVIVVVVMQGFAAELFYCDFQLFVPDVTFSELEGSPMETFPDAWVVCSEGVVSIIEHLVKIFFPREMREEFIGEGDEWQCPFTIFLQPIIKRILVPSSKWSTGLTQGL